jgi:hypothetical protein
VSAGRKVARTRGPGETGVLAVWRSEGDGATLPHAATTHAPGVARPEVGGSALARNVTIVLGKRARIFLSVTELRRGVSNRRLDVTAP